MHKLIIKPAINIAGRKILTAIMLLFLSTLVLASTSQAAEIAETIESAESKLNTERLNINPEQCVVMTQGQTCFVTVELSWQTSLIGDYCLFSSQREEALDCWIKQSSGEFKQEFVATSNIDFFLRQKNNSDTLITAVLKMAWVHKKKGKPRMSWRMF